VRLVPPDREDALRPPNIIHMTVKNYHYSNVASSNVFTPSLAKTRQQRLSTYKEEYRGTDKSLARPTSRCILFDGKNIRLILFLYVKGQ